VIIICYDGSDDAKAAIEKAGQLFEGRPATVLTVWERFVDIIARTGGGFGYSASLADPDAIDRASEEAARSSADEGVGLARAAGLNPQPRTRSRAGTIAEAILEEAEADKADVIVMGSRGLTGVRSFLLGSVSHAVLQHADRPVVVVPSPAVAERRAADRGH
jgi:nucleotide-binding universal stress UspA family protein